MTVRFEVDYPQPEDADRERRIAQCASRYGGHVTLREVGGQLPNLSICLTVRFRTWETAEAAAAELCQAGERVSVVNEHTPTRLGEP
jgi:hypothetical protein